MGGRRAQHQRVRDRRGNRQPDTRKQRGEFPPRRRRSSSRRLAARAFPEIPERVGRVGAGGLRVANGGRAPANDVRQQCHAMSDPTPLLVPMALQALLVNNDVAKQPFHRWTANYANLNEFADPIPPGFSESEHNPPGNGVHLHWKLPSALTRARGRSTKATFLFTPNRWMVVRLLASAADTAAPPKLSAWIVESDFMDPITGTSPFANPNTSQSGRVETTMLGRSVAIEQWEGEPGGEMFLKPTGLADVTFTVFQPGIENVFSFHDATAFPDNTLLTYLVAGWYSDPQHDPLMTPDPLAPTQNPPVKLTPDALNWNVLGNAAEAPSLCVLHGMIYGIPWQNHGVSARIG